MYIIIDVQIMSSTKKKKGNEAAAIVNATVTNMTGIIISPAVILILLNNLTDIDILDTFFKLAMKIMIPFFVGQIIRVSVGDKGRKWILRKKAYFKKCVEMDYFILFFVRFQSHLRLVLMQILLMFSMYF